MNITIELDLDAEQTEMYNDAIKDMFSADIFSTDCIGQWAFGVDSSVQEDGTIDWLLLEEDQDPEHKLKAKAKEAWKNGQTLPKGYHYFNRDTAKKVIAQGMLQHGIGFLDGTTDANDLDIAIQQVVLGSHVYC